MKIFQGGDAHQPTGTGDVVALIAQPTRDHAGDDQPRRESPQSEQRELAPERGALATDADLARALLARRPEAAMLVRQRFLPVIRRLLRRALRSDARAEDVEQEVFLNLFSTIHRLRRPEAFRAFVLTIAKRTLGHELRRRRARAHLAVEHDLQDSDVVGEVADAAARQAYHHFRRLLERLKERERRAFVLRFVARMDAEEIAEVLGVSPPTARRSFMRAWRHMTLWADRHPFLREYLSGSAPPTERAKLGRRSK